VHISNVEVKLDPLQALDFSLPSTFLMDGGKTASMEMEVNSF
jgi:hypothetical protein